METDAELIARARDGDTAAYGALVRRYERAVFAKAWAVLHDYHSAQDVVQEAFLRAYERLGSLRRGGAFGAWLLQTAYRQAVDAVRRNGRATATESSPVASSPAPFSEDEEALLAAVARLPEHEQQVVTAHYFDGHTAAEIAQMQGCGVGTVTKRLQRARERLRAMLAEVEA